MTEPQALTPPTAEDLPDLLTRPYNPSDFKDEQGQWFDFDPDVEGKVILNDFENGRQSWTGAFRLCTYIMANIGGGGEALTFAAPLVKSGTNVALDTSATATALAGDGTTVTGGKITVVPSTDTGQLITVGTDDNLLYTGS